MAQALIFLSYPKLYNLYTFNDSSSHTLYFFADFHGMWGMGTVLRDTGAFFMRRQFGNDKLYSTTFSEYVREIVLNGDIALEFFIEGTRSRSLKSLPPKFGLLSMALKPLFFGEIPDITIVPISISYDRVMEDKLFASELLGVPKPKETTAVSNH